MTTTIRTGASGSRCLGSFSDFYLLHSKIMRIFAPEFFEELLSIKLLYYGIQ